MKLSKSLVYNIALALLTATLLFALFEEGHLRRLEFSGLDLLFRLRGAIAFNPKVVIVEISDSDIAQIGRWPWDRSWLAAIAKALSDLGAKSVYFDIILSEKSPHEENDLILEEAIKTTGKVYLPFAFQGASADINNSIIPLERFSANIKGTGAINIYPDSDGTLRRIPLVFLGKDNIYPHSALKVATDYMGYDLKGITADTVILSNDKNVIRIPTAGGADYRMIINWSGRWEDTFKHYSLLDVLASYKDFREGKMPAIDPGAFKDSVCLVGITAVGLYDIKPVPIQPEYPGIGIFATTISNILNRDFIRVAPIWVVVALLYLLTMLPGFLIFGEKPLHEIISVFLAGSFYSVTSFVLFKHGIFLDLFTPLVGLLSSYVMVSVYNFVRIAVERQNFFKMSVTDGLTGLYNIRYFKMLLETEVMLASADPNKKFCIVMTDVDHFKTFNDTYGHQVGDLVLKSVAMVLKNSVRALDVVARYGGEEMILLLRGSSLTDGMHVAEKVRKNVESCIVKDQAKNYNVRVSCGVATYKRGDSIDTIVKRADDGLYKSKSDGRNRVSTIEADQAQSLSSN